MQQMEAITANYVEHADDWSVTVTGRGEEWSEHAPGIIAARDRAEQLIESLKSATAETAVVHLLRGSALEFTTTYMTARLSRDTSDGATTSNEDLVPEQARGEPDRREAAEDASASPPRESEEAESTTPDTPRAAQDDSDDHGAGDAGEPVDSAQELAQQ